MTTYSYTPTGVCSRHMEIDIEDNIIKEFRVLGGCSGNLQGIAALVRGMNVDDAISRLHGIDCRGKGTSCPDQLSKALIEYKNTL